MPLARAGKSGSFLPPEQFNLADYFLDERIRSGQGERIAIRTASREWSYRQVQVLANRFANLLSRLGVAVEQRVLIALHDTPEFAGALFGVLKVGGVVVAVNPNLPEAEAAYFLAYSRAPVVILSADSLAAFGPPAAGRKLVVVGGSASGHIAFEAEQLSGEWENHPTHRDDPAMWIFSGGTTGRPKAAAQTHRAFANSTECYAKGLLAYSPQDRTLAIPKLYFGYATGSNLLFPFSVGATACLFPERCTPQELFAQIRRHRPTILINVPKMVKAMVDHPGAAPRDLAGLRLATSAGEALPSSLYQRWMETFGVELLDGLGTAEMWHIFLSNRPGRVRPGTLGQAVPGFEVKVADPAGNELPPGQVGHLWVKGNSRAICYWQRMEESVVAFRGEWFASNDLVSSDEQGYITYRGRGDDMLKVGGKWLAPVEVESCLLTHPAVRECALVGVPDEAGLMRPVAYVRAEHPSPSLAQELKQHVLDRLEPYKHPRRIVFVERMPTTHLGKVDRGKLREANP